LVDGQRINKQSRVWLAGRWQQNPALDLLLGLAPIPKTDADMLSKLRGVALSLYPQEKGWTLDGAFQGRDEIANQAIEKYLATKQFPQAKSYRVVPADPNAAGPDAQWVTLQARMDAEALRNLRLR